MQKSKVRFFSVVLLMYISICNTAFAISSVDTSTTSIPFKQDNTDYSRVWFVTVLVLVFVALGAYVVRKYMGIEHHMAHNKARRIELVESKRLSTKTVIFFVKIENRKVIIIESNDGLRILNVMADQLAQEDDVVC